MESSEKYVSDELLRIIAAFASCFIFVKIFDWLRLFEGTAFYVHLVGETFSDILAFLILLLITLMTFGVPMYMLNLNRDAESDNELIDSNFGFWGLNVLLNQYMLSLGEFNYDNFADNPQTRICYFFFLASTFVSSLTMLNMLIAIMGDTFGRVMEKKDINSVQTRLQLMADNSHTIPRYSKEDDKRVFLFVVSPVERTGDDEDWAGTISQMTRVIETQVGNLSKQFDQRIRQLQEQNGELSKRVINIDRDLKNQV